MILNRRVNGSAWGESAGAPAHSKTWRNHEAPSATRQRFGLRCCCTALLRGRWNENHPVQPNHTSPEKRRSTGALQNLAESRGTFYHAPAFWTAVLLHRFVARALERKSPCSTKPRLTRKAPEHRRTPKPGGTTRHLLPRASVLDCGAAAPLCSADDGTKDKLIRTR
jgi:hypothetical protein